MQVYKPDETPPAPPPIAVDTRTGAAMLSICDDTLGKLAVQHDVPRAKLGKKTLYSVADLRELFDTLKKRPSEEK